MSKQTKFYVIKNAADEYLTDWLFSPVQWNNLNVVRFKCRADAIRRSKAARLNAEDGGSNSVVEIVITHNIVSETEG